MSNNRLIFDGLEALKAALRNLPAALVAEGSDIVATHATRAEATIDVGYPRHAGHLREKLTVTHTRSAFGAISIVRDTDSAAAPLEVGSRARHTSTGANRGSMPPNHIFSATAKRERDAMYADHKELLTRNGLIVTGEA